MAFPDLKHSLRYQVTLSILVFSGAITLVVTGFQLFMEYRNDIAEIHRGMEAIERSYLGPLTTAVWFFNQDSIQLQLEGMLQLRDIEYLEVRDGGHLLLSAGQMPEQKGITRTFPLEYSYKNRFRPIGELKVVAGMEGVYARLRERVFRILLSQGIKTFIVAAFMLLIVQTLVTRHLFRIDAYLRHLDLKRDLEPLRLERKGLWGRSANELDRIAETINQMRDALQSSYALLQQELERRKTAEKRLQTAYDAVEQRVRERTAQLRQVNQSLVAEIAEREEIQTALAESEQRLALALKGGDLGLWDMNVVTGQTFYSRRLAEILGHRPEELEPWLDAWSHRIHPEDRSRVQAAYQAHLSGQNDFYEAEYRLKSSTGDWVWVLARGRVVDQDASGAPLRMTGTLLDLSERKLMEAELIRAKKLEAIGILAGGIAHDFNNLLFIMMGNISMAKEMAGPEKPVHGFLTETETAIAEASRLTQKFITFAPGGDPVRKPAAISQMLAETAQMVCDSSQHPLDLEIAPDLWPAAVDSGQIQQVFYNVLENAKQAGPAGARIAIQAQNIAITSRHRGPQYPPGPGRYLKIAITDQGAGIPEKDLANVFVPYFTAKPRGSQKGMGLGLTIAFSVVRKHHGHIHIQSQTGQGTTVVIYLPADERKKPLPQN